MAYELSFAQDFFMIDGEVDMQATVRPKTVLQAIVSLYCYDRERFNTMLFEIFDIDADKQPADMFFLVLEKVEKTNTCSNLDSPVYVWVDPDGFYQLPVYD